MIQQTEQIKKQILGLKDIFSKTAMECVNLFFGKECMIHMPWELVEQLQAKFDKILIIGSSNTKYSALMSAGIQNDSLDAFVGTENTGTEEAFDVLGEFTNNYIGMLADNNEFRNSFGILSQGVPMLFSNGQSFLPFIWGIEGYLYIGPHWIYISYTIRENVVE